MLVSQCLSCWRGQRFLVFDQVSVWAFLLRDTLYCSIFWSCTHCDGGITHIFHSGESNYTQIYLYPAFKPTGISYITDTLLDFPSVHKLTSEWDLCYTHYLCVRSCRLEHVTLKHSDDYIIKYRAHLYTGNKKIKTPKNLLLTLMCSRILEKVPGVL